MTFEGHTPGPWRKEGHDWVSATGVVVFEFIPYEGGYFVCDEDETIAMAAPDLLVENQRLREALEGIRDMPTYDQDDHLRLRNIAREALKEVEG